MKFKIPATVVDTTELSNNHIKIKVVGSHQNDSIKKGQIYDIHLKNIQIANEKSWNAIMKEEF